MYALGEVSTAQLEADFTATVKQLHGAAASIADSKARYEATRDPRYLASVQAVYPVFRSLMAKAQAISEKITAAEMPSSFMQVLDDTGDWLLAQGKNVVEGTTGFVKTLGNPLVVLGVLGVAFLALGGNKILPRR